MPAIQVPSPNHALQRTATGGQPFSVYHVPSRQWLSLSLGPLGASTRNMEPWAFADAPNVATVTIRQVVHGGAPVLLVSHDLEDGDWQFLTGGVVDLADILLVTLRSMVERDPSLAELADLPLGWEAQRERPDSAWVRRLAAPST